jgi:hypothetical protein
MNPGPLWALFRQCEVAHLNDAWRGLYSRVDAIYNELGPWAADRMLQIELASTSSESNCFFKLIKLIFLADALGQGKLDMDLKAETSPETNRLILLAAQARPMSPLDVGVSPKIKKLLSVLKKFATDQGPLFCCIVFVERRVTAQILAETIRSLSEISKIIRCAVLVSTSHRF